MLFMLKQYSAIWQKRLYLACGLYGVSWLLGIIITLTFAPRQVIQQLLINPSQAQDAWYYISHNIGVESVLLLGAFTFGVGTGLILCMNGLLDGILATAIARHYGLSVLLAGLLPHGLFEACAWILISTCSFLLSNRFKHIISSLWNNKGINTPDKIKGTISIKNLKDIYFSLIITSTLLLVLAGIIEAYVSPMLLRALINATR